MVGHSEDHSESKRDLATFLGSNAYLGLQRGPGMLIALANCPHCHTTLALLLLDADVSTGQLEELKACVHALLVDGRYEEAERACGLARSAAA